MLQFASEVILWYTCKTPFIQVLLLLLLVIIQYLSIFPTILLFSCLIRLRVNTGDILLPSRTASPSLVFMQCLSDHRSCGLTLDYLGQLRHGSDTMSRLVWALRDCWGPGRFTEGIFFRNEVTLKGTAGFSNTPSHPGPPGVTTQSRSLSVNNGHCRST